MSDNNLTSEEIETFDNSVYSNYPLETVASDACNNFLRHTKTTPVVGATPYTFRINVKTKRECNAFIQAMRTALSRLRRKATYEGLTIAKFTMQFASADPIYLTSETKSPDFWLITVERRNEPLDLSKVIPIDLLNCIIVANPEDIRSVKVQRLLKQLDEQPAVEIDATNWDDMCAAMWCVAQNHAIYKSFWNEENVHLIGRI